MRKSRNSRNGCFDVFLVVLPFVLLVLVGIIYVSFWALLALQCGTVFWEYDPWDWRLVVVAFIFMMLLISKFHLRFIRKH